MKTKLKGKILAILMSLAMVFTMMPMMGGAVYADDPIYTITIDPGLGTGTAFTKTSRMILTEEDIEDGHYDNTGGSFFIRESTGEIEYKFPDTCDFEAPSKTKFDGWNDGIRDWAWEPGQELELSRLFNGTTSNSMTITAHYKDISCGENLDWNCRWPNKDGLNIYGSGAMYDFTDPNSDKPAPWYDERDHIKGIVFYDAVTNIGDYAFAYLDLIWSNSLPQEIPSSVTKIGNYAFAYSNLYKIRIGTPSSLTSIGDYAFAYTKLDYKGDSRLVIPSPVTSKTIEWTIDKATVKVTAPAGKTFTYNGKAKTGVASGANYTLSGTVKATKAGTFTAKATLETNANYIYKWADGTTAVKSIKWKINKAANPLTIKARTATVKYSAVKKKAQVVGVTKVIAFTKKGQGKMTYTKASGNKKITIAKTTGKVTVKKGLKKGTYKVKVKVKAAGNANYNASAVKTVTFKVRVK